jgi:hypothetical protein
MSGSLVVKSMRHIVWLRSIIMKSIAHGLDTSPVEVTHISRFGFWLLINRVLKNGLMPSAPNHGFHFFDVSEA